MTYPPVAVVHRHDYTNQFGAVFPLDRQQQVPPQHLSQPQQHRRHKTQLQRVSDPGSEASSRGSLSDSSSGSHRHHYHHLPQPVPPPGNLDPSTAATPTYPEKAVTGSSGSASDSGPFALGSPRVDEAVIESDSGAAHPPRQPVACARTSWTAETPFPAQDSHPSRGYHHEGPDSVAIYTPTTKTESTYREPNAVLVLVCPFFFDHLACRAFISNIGLDSPLRTGPNPHCLHRSICIPGPTLRNPHHSTPLLRPRLPQHIIQLPTLPTLNPRPAFPRTSRTITSIIIIFSLPLPSSSSSQSFLPSPQLLPSIPHRRRGGRRRRHQHRHHLRG